MKQIILILIFFSAQSVFCQTVFNYDANGNMVSIKYNGNNPCKLLIEHTESSAVVLNISPNPASVYINIQVSLKQDGTFAIELYNVLGEQIGPSMRGIYMKGQTAMHVYKLDISQFPAGLYLCVLKTNKETFSLPFVKI